MTNHNVLMTSEAIQLLNEIVDATKDFDAWVDEQLKHRHELSCTEQYKLDDVAVLASKMAEFKREYLDPPRGIVICRAFPGGVQAYWDGHDWTEYVRKAKVYASKASARATITRKTRQYVKQYNMGKHVAHHLSQWSNAYAYNL